MVNIQLCTSSWKWCLVALKCLLVHNSGETSEERRKKTITKMAKMTKIIIKTFLAYTFYHTQHRDSLAHFRNCFEWSEYKTNTLKDISVWLLFSPLKKEYGEKEATVLRCMSGEWNESKFLFAIERGVGKFSGFFRISSNYMLKLTFSPFSSNAWAKNEKKSVKACSRRGIEN